MSSKYDIDISGKKFGGWTVLHRDSDHLYGTYSKWICRCVCGTVRSVETRELINHKSQSCGCLHSNLHRNLIGQKFGFWTVIDRALPIKNSARRWRAWKCRCKCGTIKDVSEQSLLTGKSTSCGCKRGKAIRRSEPYEDLTGKHFGYWTVIKHLPNTRSLNGALIQNWLCKCICGTEKSVSRSNLLSGRSISCGCINYSKMELFVCFIIVKRFKIGFCSSKNF